MSNESIQHLSLKEKAKNILINLGFKKNQIFFEYLLPINEREFFKVDVVGKKENKIIGIECGTISRKGKFEKLKELCDEVIHLPYERDESKVKPITLKIEEELWNKFKLKTSRTITLNEALINLIKKDVANSYNQKEVKKK